MSRLLERVERVLTQSTFEGVARDTAREGVYATIARSTLSGSNRVTASVARVALEQQLAALIARGEVFESYGLLSLRDLRVVFGELAHARANARGLPTLLKILKPYLDSMEARIEALQPALLTIDAYVTGVSRFLD